MFFDAGDADDSKSYINMLIYDISKDRCIPITFRYRSHAVINANRQLQTELNSRTSRLVM